MNRVMIECKGCGEQIPLRAELCMHCGSRNLSYKSKFVAGILALFVGGFGIHKFYLGKPIQGLIYLVFSWTFIPALIGFIEGIRYFLMSEEDFLFQYGKR